MFKQEKGITLVALVITIIVLLILAGVSISLVIGDNGVLTKAQRAGTETDKASAYDTLSLAVSSVQGIYGDDFATNNITESFGQYLTKQRLVDAVAAQGGGYTCETDAADFSSTTPADVTIKKGDKSWKFTIQANGQVGVTIKNK